VLLVPVAAACTDSGGDADVQVSLQDDAVTPDPASGAAGSLTFSATNDGTETHEIEIFSGDVDPATLPVEDNVASTEGLRLVDEIEDITPGSSADLTVDLDAGPYVIMCNLPGHFAQGMYSTFEVS
jgi:uncharacterized cupredoxin-like copper-binding protein